MTEAAVPRTPSRRERQRLDTRQRVFEAAVAEFRRVGFADAQLDRLGALLRAYGELGGTSIQINVIDKATLLEAQANPEKYSNLLVRVTGYNAYFVTIGRGMQDEIIARSSHGRL